MAAKVLQIENLCKSYYPDGEEKRVLEGVSLTVGEGELVALLGPSGCGKTTVLNLAAGFDTGGSGTVAFRGAPVAGPSPERGVVFQSPQLFEWLNVEQNIAFGLKRRRLDKEERDKLVAAMVKALSLEGFEKAYPDQLSGGMAQRVAIGRSLILSPALLLMDEPFSALDAQLRYRMQRFLLSLRAQYRPAILFVTHDIEEAILLADRIYVMTPAPARILAEVPVPFLKDDPDLVRRPEFFALKTRIFDLLEKDRE